MNLSLKDRLVLWNQYAILEVLHPEDADYYTKMKEILENGYRMHYDDLCPHIDRDEFSEEESREVIRILAMFEVIQDSIGAGGTVDGVAPFLLSFAGFDGNYEVGQLAYLRFLVEKQERFRHVVTEGQYNSHAPLLGRYREMLRRFQDLGNPQHLTEAQVRLIAAGESV